MSLDQFLKKVIYLLKIIMRICQIPPTLMDINCFFFLCIVYSQYTIFIIECLHVIKIFVEVINFHLTFLPLFENVINNFYIKNNLELEENLLSTMNGFIEQNYL